MKRGVSDAGARGWRRGDGNANDKLGRVREEELADGEPLGAEVRVEARR